MATRRSTKTTTAKPTVEKKTSDYLDEFYRVNGKRGFESLAELPLTGNRAEDRELVRAAIAERARTPQPTGNETEMLIGERGCIPIESIMAGQPQDLGTPITVPAETSPEQ